MMINLNNLKIGTRLKVGFGVLLGLLVVLIAINDTVSSRNRRDLREKINVSSAKFELTNIFKAAKLEGVVAARSISIQTDVGPMNKEEAKIREQAKIAADARNKLIALGVSEEGKKVFANITRLEAALEKPTADAITAALAFNTEAATSIIAGKVDPLYLQLLGEINALVKVHKEEEREVLEAGERSAQQLQYLLMAIGAVAVVIGLLLARAITAGIVRPLDAAVAIAKRVAEGDLSSTIEVHSKDETGELMAALRLMNQNLVDVVREVRSGTETISSASSQIASGNQELATRTEEQANALQETVRSMDALTRTVHENEGSAKDANQLALSASEVAVKGGAVVAQVVDTMGAINESAYKIVDIIGVIDGIAFQTNILALNAAVEAARAGEQGRGFAVVATEVRNLAQRSAAAAREIKSLIDGSVAKIEAGNALVSEAGQTMSEIVTSVQKVTDIMGEIANASREQTQGIEQISHTVTQMDEGTQQNAALVEEASAAAASMQEMADSLERVVRVFNLGDSKASVTPLHAARGGRPRGGRPGSADEPQRLTAT
jgi:methyl-accepting chemotaxis protein